MKRLLLVLSICFYGNNLLAGPPSNATSTEALARIIKSNAEFTEGLDKNHFNKLVKGQNPKTTFVGCSDSRVHMHSFSMNPEDNIFVIRTIGNQISFPLGSIKYGVNHVNTPLLLIVGHTGCGAVTAKMTGAPIEDPDIKKELENVEVFIKTSHPKGWEIERNVEYNVHRQVDKALDVFKDRVKDGKLIIVGAMYDFHKDTEEEVLGRIKILNVRDQTNAAKGSSIETKGNKLIIMAHIKDAIERTKDSVLLQTRSWMKKALDARTKA